MERDFGPIGMNYWFGYFVKGGEIEGRLGNMGRFERFFLVRGLMMLMLMSGIPFIQKGKVMLFTFEVFDTSAVDIFHE